MDKIMVTIYCFAYNHEQYIRKALEGFVVQKTNFEFEVLINDDASSDGTAEIISEYAQKYSYIKPFFQKENLYSQGISITRKVFFPETRGKYIAYCEGDDYWTDPLKLQKQIDWMENHPDCSMCCHAYSNIEANSERFIEEVHTAEKTGYVEVENIIAYVNPTQLATNVFPRRILLEMPDVYWNRGVGDYTTLLYAITQGKIYYMSENMANHRVNSDGSWSMRVYQNPEKRCAHNERMIDFLKDYEEVTNGEYSKSIEQKIESYRMDCAITKHQYKEQKANKGFSSLSLRRKVIVLIGLLFPRMATYIEKKVAGK